MDSHDGHGHARGPHDHPHPHGEHGHGHHHAVAVDADNERRVRLALALTAGFTLAEVAGGLLSGSLALLADAGHMAADSAALALSWYAFRVGRRPATPARTFGHHRFQVLAALVNGLSLMALSAWIVLEAAGRLLDPVPVLGLPMLAVAVTGLVVNIAAFLVLNGGSRENLNVRGAALHVLGDLLGSVAAILAAGVVILTGWTPIDPILSVLVAILILRSAWALAAESWHVLMEGTPRGLDPEALRAALLEVRGVRDVHHVHGWSLTPERTLVTLHARLAEGADHDAVLFALHRTLRERFGVPHATIQLERGGCPDQDDHDPPGCPHA